MCCAKKRNACWLCLLAVALFLTWSVGVAYGQSAASATIVGRALDPNGASVPDAKVSVKNLDTDIVRTTKTTSDGLYRFDSLAPGLYDISIEASGFARAEAKGVKLQVGELRDVNFNLKLAGQKESVVVTSELPLVETSKTDLSTVIDDKSVANLPTTTSFNAIGGVANDYAGLAISVPGVKYDLTGDSSDLIGPGAVSDRGIVFNVDGGNISDQVVSARDALGASVEEVKEFQVLSNNYNAEYGQAGNVILNVVTKSGTNSIHGDAHGYFRGRNLGASDFFYNQAPTLPTRRAPFHKHEGGFTAGGPFVKDRTFWFASLEQVQQGSPIILTPFGRSVTVEQPTNELLWSAKLDHKLTEKHSFTVRYNIQRDLSDNLLVQTGQNSSPESLVSSTIHDNNLNIAVTSTPTPHTVNEARFFWHRFLTATPDKTTQPGQRLSNAYVGADFCCPQGGVQNRFQYIDNLSWTRGTHTVKTGFNISHFPYNSLFQQFHFGRYESFVDVSGNGTLRPAQFTTGVGPGFVKATDSIYGAYVQDSWQIKRNLTLNFGLRYDIEDGAFVGGNVPKPGGGCFQNNGLISSCSKDNNNWQPRIGLAWSPDFQSGILHWLFGDQGRSVVRLAAGEVTQLAYLNISLDSLNFDGVTLFTTSIKGAATDCFLSSGSPNPNPSNRQGCAVLQAFPNSPSSAALAPFVQGVRTNFGRVRPIADNLRNPEIRHASLTVERQIGPTFLFSVGYIGVFGFGLFGERDRNFPTPVADPAHAGFFYLPDRPNPAFTAIRTNENSRTSAFHGLSVTAEKRLSHHLQFQAGYVFSKVLASGEDFFGLSEPGNPLASLRADRAIAQNDIRHQGSFRFMVDTERLIGTPYLKHVINNWIFGAIGQLQSGRPYPVSTGDGAFVGSIFPALGSETQQRPSVLSDGTIITTNIASAGQANFLLSEAAVAQCNAAGLSNCSAIRTTFLAPAGASANGPVDLVTGDTVDFQFINGNLARNAGHGLPFYRFDISLLKAIQLPKRESWKLELKLDVFNVFNHPQFILNNSNDALAGLFSLPPFTVTDAGGRTIPNPSFNCNQNCINPFTGFYFGQTAGRPLKLQDFQRGRVDKDMQNPNFAGLGNPSATAGPRVIQLAIRFKW